MQPVLLLSNPSVSRIALQVLNTDGTATGKTLDIIRYACDVLITGTGVDYASGPYPVLFPAGTTMASFNIPIVNDDVSENNEQFTITIDPSSLPTGVSSGSTGASIVTILDDDGM